jgi:hypothetical protein
LEDLGRHAHCLPLAHFVGRNIPPLQKSFLGGSKIVK